ncbi:MAG: hypothetical protein H6Q89_4913 [Myxococcaceae bacterium]|nr:hypothetical protein [Myxococcaceae bacterium]
MAITGSVARGDAGPGSDLDLWLIGPGTGRRSFVERGVPVTLLMQTPAEARSFDSLCLFEVADLIVLSDPRGHFQQVKRAFAQRRAAIRRAIVEATLEDLRFELAHGAVGSTWSRVMFLRAAGFRLCALWLFKQTDWRVPRIRTLRTHLPPGARTALFRLLALPRLTPSFIRGLPATIARVDRWLKDAARRGALSRRVFADLPREVVAKWRAGEPEDAAWLLRKQLAQQWLPPLLDARGANDVANLALTDAPRGLRDLFLQAQGLKGVSAWDRRKTAQVGAQLRALARQLGLSRLLR